MRKLMLRAAGVALLVCGAATSAYATDPTAKWCQGVKIAAFPGGPQGGVFANNVYNGYRQAELDLGPSVTYYFSDWDPHKMLDPAPTRRSRPRSTASPSWAIRATTPPIRRSTRRSPRASSSRQRTPRCPKRRPSTGLKAWAMSARPTTLPASRSAPRPPNAPGLKSGDEAFVWGLKGQGGDRGQRTVGVIEALEKAGAKVIYQEIDKATDADPNAGTATFVGVMKANPGIKVVVTDHGALTSNVGVFARAASLKPGQVLFAGFDMSPNTAKAIKEGYQNLVIDQQPYLQGYLPILNICLTKKFGFSGLDVNTAGAFVDDKNVDVVAPLAAKEIR